MWRSNSHVPSVLLDTCVSFVPKSFEVGEPTDQDGCASQLFHYLWARDSNTGRPCPCVRLPHTIVFRHGHPAQWYFTSAVDGEIKRKRRCNLTNRSIHAGLVKAAGARAADENEVAAVYVCPHPAGDDSDVSGSTVVEHITFGELLTFLHTRSKQHGSILQQFVVPLAERNHTLSVAWTPGIVVVEQRVASHALRPARGAGANKVTMSDRLLTLEGTETQAFSAPVKSAALRRKLVQVTEGVVLHTAHASSRRIQLRRLLLVFKCDASNRLHLLFCASMRYQPVPAAPTLVHVDWSGTQRGSPAHAPGSPATLGRSTISTSARTTILGRASSGLKVFAGEADHRLLEVKRIQAAWRGQEARLLAFRLRIRASSARIQSAWRARQARCRTAALRIRDPIVHEIGGEWQPTVKQASPEQAEDARRHAQPGVFTARGDGANAALTDDSRLRAVDAIKVGGGPRRSPATGPAAESMSARDSRLGGPRRWATKLNLRPTSAPVGGGALAGGSEDTILAIRRPRERERRRTILMGPLNMSAKYRPASACAGGAWATDVFHCPSCGVKSQTPPTSIPCAYILACHRRLGASRAEPEGGAIVCAGGGTVAGAHKARGESRPAAEAETSIVAAHAWEVLLLPPWLRDLVKWEPGSADGEHDTRRADLSKQEVQVCEDCYLAYIDATVPNSRARPGAASLGAGSPMRPLPGGPDARRASGASCISLLPRPAPQLGRSARPMSAPAPARSLATDVAPRHRPPTASDGPARAGQLLNQPMAHAGLQGTAGSSRNSRAGALGSADGVERPAVLCAAERFDTRLASALALDPQANSTTRADFYRYGGVGVMLAPPPTTKAARSRRPHTASAWPEAAVLSKTLSTAPVGRQPVRSSKSLAGLREHRPKRESRPRTSQLARAWLESPYQLT